MISFKDILKVFFLKISFSLRRIIITISQTDHLPISENFVKALIISEDKRFMRHFGVDPIAICRAFWSFVYRRRLEGASTIEQQLVRTITRRYEISFYRKIREIFLSCLLFLYFSKEQIAHSYLAIAYFGWQMNGIIQACHRLSIRIETANLQQASQIIARLKYPEPEAINPLRHQKIRNRTEYILRLLNTGTNNGSVHPIISWESQHGVD